MKGEGKCVPVHITKTHEPLEVKLLLCLNSTLDEMTG